jgi:hypothetical protein
MKRKSHALASYGSLYISISYICFHGKILGRSSKVLYNTFFSNYFKEQIPIADIHMIKTKTHEKHKSMSITLNNVKISYKFHFKTDKEADEAADVIRQLHSKQVQDQSGAVSEVVIKPDVPAVEEEEPGKIPSKILKVLSQDEWDVILKGAKTLSVPKGGIIINQGEEYQRIYQISKGICATVVLIDHLSASNISSSLTLVLARKLPWVKWFKERLLAR